jgi:hypothetical protein
MRVNLYYTRLSARGTINFQDEFVSDSGRRLTTCATLTDDDRLPVSQAFWKDNLLPHGYLLSSLRKHYFYGEPFAIIELFNLAGELAGYYVDITTPLTMVGGDYYLTDLFLDYWLGPGQPPRPLDEGEFEEAIAAGVMSSAQIDSARTAFARLPGEIRAGIFPNQYIEG